MSDSSFSIPDSPLSITASIVGILTFVVAIAAAAFVRIRYLSSADQEFYRVKKALQWYKTESEFINDLLLSADTEKQRGALGRERVKQYQMCAYVVDQLGKLEESLLALVTGVEEDAERRVEVDKEGGNGGRKFGKNKTAWTLVPEKGVVAVSWLQVRTEAMELVRQRDALGSRVLFAQLSMISTRVMDQEKRAAMTEETNRDQVAKLESILQEQSRKIEQLEEMIKTVIPTVVNEPTGFKFKQEPRVLVSRNGNYVS